MLFETHLAKTPSDLLFQYDVTADGLRFLLNTVTESSMMMAPLTVVVNWREGLTQT